MKLLLVGCNGQLGVEVLRCLRLMTSESGPIPKEYAGAVIHCVGKDQLDISSQEDVVKWYRENGPYNLTINCAAYTNVDGCEGNEYYAVRANALGPWNLAKCTKFFGGKLVHVSTDYVFSGRDDSPRSEEDSVQPISAYGRSKWLGEIFVREVCAQAFIIRTAWLYGYRGKNFVKTMIRLAKEQGKIQVVDDQWGSPTNANDVARIILKVALTEEYGIYHCTNSGSCTWYDFANSILNGIGVDCEIVGISSLEYKKKFPISADRPKYSVLDNNKISSITGLRMRDWKEALSTYLNNLNKYGDENVI